MNTVELRIGNWVRICFHDKEGWENVIVTAIHNDGSIDTTSKETKKYYFEPIPLSPEILEKCGFVKFETHKEMSIDVTHNSSLTYFYGNSKDYIAIETSPADEHEPGSVNYVVLDVQYLHQLQNLYYSLTQTELNIKL